MNTKILVGGVAVILIIAGAFWWGMSGSSSSQQSPATQTQEAGTPGASTATDTPSTTQSGTSYSLADVAQHNSSSSCWSAINGKVYDLTSWINQHPGGPDKILAICGIDGSSAFNAQHGGQSRPANELAGFLIGDLTTQ
jgi:cytochrome b involved in lipid metabolism